MSRDLYPYCDPDESNEQVVIPTSPAEIVNDWDDEDFDDEDFDDEDFDDEDDDLDGDEDFDDEDDDLDGLARNHEPYDWDIEPK